MKRQGQLPSDLPVSGTSTLGLRQGIGHRSGQPNQATAELGSEMEIHGRAAQVQEILSTFTDQPWNSSTNRTSSCLWILHPVLSVKLSRLAPLCALITIGSDDCGPAIAWPTWTCSAPGTAAPVSSSAHSVTSRLRSQESSSSTGPENGLYMQRRNAGCMTKT